jgi:hypothetical protein
MMSKPRFTVTLLVMLIPCVTHAKERGTIVDIWHQIDLYEHHYCVYRVETQTHFYEFLGEYPQSFQLGDSLTFTLDKDHQHAQVIGGRGKNPKLLLIKEELKEIKKDPHERCGECRFSVRVLPGCLRFRREAGEKFATIQISPSGETSVIKHGLEQV